jgi:hypothetical protein
VCDGNGEVSRENLIIITTSATIIKHQPVTSAVLYRFPSLSPPLLAAEAKRKEPTKIKTRKFSFQLSVGAYTYFLQGF